MKPDGYRTATEWNRCDSCCYSKIIITDSEPHRLTLMCRLTEPKEEVSFNCICDKFDQREVMRPNSYYVVPKQTCIDCAYARRNYDHVYNPKCPNASDILYMQLYCSLNCNNPTKEDVINEQGTCDHFLRSEGT